MDSRLSVVDIISPDISVPWHNNKAIINEVNFAPLFGGGEISRHYMKNFFTTFIHKDGRIPIEVFVGDDDETMQNALKKQKQFIQEGSQCFLTTHSTTLDAQGKRAYFSSTKTYAKNLGFITGFKCRCPYFSSTK